jgi:cytochrome c553
MPHPIQGDIMNTKNSKFALALITAALLTLTGCADPLKSRNVSDPEVAGQTLALQVCSACHGVTGESTSPAFPKLAGQQHDYLLAQLGDFKGHERSDSKGVQYMWGFTHITTKQVEELADYFSSQKPMRANFSDGAVLARGKAIFESGVPDKGVVQCGACHGPTGEGNAAFPRLAGQHPAYVLEQIKVFQLTDARPRGAPMKQVTHELTDSDAFAVAQYVGSIGIR